MLKWHVEHCRLNTNCTSAGSVVPRGAIGCPLLAWHCWQSRGREIFSIFSCAEPCESWQFAQFSVTGAPAMGSYSTLYTDPKTLQQKLTTQSPILSQLQAQLGTDQTFAGDITKLTKLNLAPDLLSQIITAGPGGTTGLDALANSSPSDIAQINKADAAVNIAARSFGEQVAQTGYQAQTVALLKQLLAVLPGSVTKTALVQTNAAAAAAVLRARTITTTAKR